MFANESSSSSESSSSDSSDDECQSQTKMKKASAIKSTEETTKKLMQNFKVFQPPKKLKTKKVKEDQSNEMSEGFVVDASGSSRNMTYKLNKPLRKIFYNEDIDIEMSSSLDVGVELKPYDVFSCFDSRARSSKLETKIPSSKIEELMKKSVINEEFHKKECVKPYIDSIRAAKKQRKEEREKTKGANWFNLPATEVTEERKRDLEIMQIRDALDTKQFYRHDDRKVLPKYFQIGTVIEDPSDYYSARIPKKQRKQTIVEELLADADFRRQNRRKYKEIAEERSKVHKKRTFHKKPGGKKSSKV